jgi:hypothetical protein
MNLPFAHAGHWITDLLTVVPVVIVIAVLVIHSWREKRRGGGTGPVDAPPPAA